MRRNKGRINLVVVEDDADELELLMLAMKMLDYPVRISVARDGSQARELLENKRRTGASVDLMLVDLKLPKVDGLQVLKELQAHELNVFFPKIVLTSSDEPNVVSECYRYGANSVVCKPVDFEGFIAMVIALANYWFEHHVNPWPS